MSDSADNGITVIVSIAPIVCFIAITMGCVCGCRKQIPKNELLGLAGMVKLTDPDVEFNYTVPQQVTVTSETPPDRNSYSSHIRVNGSVGGGGGAVSRSLPDLPVGPCSTQDNTGDGYPDTTSDLYATLDLDGEGRKSREEDSTEKEPVETPGSPSYAQPSEERYARVGSEERIPAASAIAGIVPANHDLPYMTPPPQPNFSGDSHDSHKGYTSISVREPLSRIMAVGGNNRPITSHPHYATLSDVDSDDMYAAIEENNGAPGSDTYARIGGAREMGDYATSESETYAQIGPRVTTRADIVQCREENGGGDYGTSGSETYAQIAPRPSRQDSPQPYNSQGLPHSNNTSPGSLRKEKREANSPLPEPPSPIGTDPLTKLPLPNPPSPLDAMYAKVVKKQKSSESNSASPSPSSPVQQIGNNEVDRHYESLDRPCSTEPPYEKIQENRSKPNSKPTLRVILGPISTTPEPCGGSPPSISISISSTGVYSGIGPSTESTGTTSSGASSGVVNSTTMSTSGEPPKSSSPVAELYAQVIKSPTQR